MRKIVVITGARSDYGIYLPLLKKIKSDADLELHLFVTGMHLSPEFGMTVQAITRDGFEIEEQVEMLVSSDSPQGIAKSIGLGIIGFAQAYTRFMPDILIVLGDRFEMYAAAVAALPFRIPVAHIHGGEVTNGAIDDAIRHSITKLSHLHFVAIEEYAKRVIQLGEEPWRVTVSGALSLDNMNFIEPLSAQEVEARFRLSLKDPPLLVTFHPVTMEYERTDWQINELLEALKSFDMPIVFTLPNADTHGRIIRNAISKFIEQHKNSCMVDSFGVEGYFSMMKYAAAMVGNSSSGIIEAPSFKLPAVNIGTRQRGRVRAANVIDVGYIRNEIIEGVSRSLSQEFRDGLDNLANPYGNRHAAQRIIEVLRGITFDDQLTQKRFYDCG
ncbi:MAG: UDP-N-acetylglucosamine 2-epimerase [Pseudomonadota bacterium]